MARPVLFSLTLFVSAALLFGVQPMTGRMLLPLLGGVPAVWNGCMVFFQITLLAGYVYSHFLSRLGGTWLLAAHLSVAFLPLLLTPIALSPDRLQTIPTTGDPIVWLLATLLETIGLPFFCLATTAPLLQSWFARLDHPTSPDPYYLYAASNVGSLAALLAYPLLIEPALGLREQVAVWRLGYFGFVVLLACCALVTVQSSGKAKVIERCPSSLAEPSPSPGWTDCLHWLALAAVPSSLLLGVTTFLTTDVAAMPLAWVVPLALYLTTFILAFADWDWGRSIGRFANRTTPLVVVVLLVLTSLPEHQPPLAIQVVVHLAGFFVIAMTCHSRLAAERPVPYRLTSFYLSLSTGGVIGGCFNALAAPFLFTNVVEYPLVLALSCFFLSPTNSKRCVLPGSSEGCGPRPAASVQLTDVALPLALGLATATAMHLLTRDGRPMSLLEIGILFGVPAIVVYSFHDRPFRFAFGVAALFLVGSTYDGGQMTLWAERNFFGTLRVTLDPDGRIRRLVHGRTLHGMQFVDPRRRTEPLAYYHRAGPFGQIEAAYREGPTTPQVAVIGLGAGAMASYGRPGETWTFYELDPAVAAIANDQRFFTFLADSQATIRIKLGDARLRLREADDGCHGMVVLDAFSSDAIPTHLLTREAMALYLRKLAADGILAFHVSNRYFDVPRIVQELAHDAGLECWLKNDLWQPPEDRREGIEPSQWLVVTRDARRIPSIARSVLWERLAGSGGLRVWTDDYANPLSVLKWE